jgi:hypothetical protein
MRFDGVSSRGFVGDVWCRDGSVEVIGLQGGTGN